MSLTTKHRYQYLRSVVLKPYKKINRNFVIVLALVVLLGFSYITWSSGCCTQDYRDFYRPIPRDAYCEPRLFDYGVGQHDIRKSFGKFAAKHPRQPPAAGPRLDLHRQGVQAARDFKNFLQAALRENLDPTAILAMSRRYLRSMEVNLHRMIPEEFLQASLTKLENLKQRIVSAVDDLQHPPRCRNVINCRITTKSGMSSGLHEVLYCLVLGLHKNKTVALDTSGWPNFSETPWQNFFPHFGSCPTAPGNEDIDVTSEYRKMMKFLPSSFGKFIAENYGDPYAWWYGILMAYILRPSETLLSTFDAYLVEQTKGRPYVAIHIRRTDKKGEALYRPLESYLAEAEEYFARLSLTQDVTEKLVYIATDDPSMLDDLDTKFKSFEFISNRKVASEANSYSLRRRGSAVLGIMMDYYMLAHADHLVCTLSSGFCRVAYELMSGIRNDAWLRISSLDNDFYYAYVLQPEREMVEPYEDGVFTSEIRDAYKSDVPDSFQQMITVTLAKSYSPFGADGFAYTNDVRRTIAKFKTAPAYLTTYFNSSISEIKV